MAKSTMATDTNYYAEFVERKRHQYSDAFDDSCLHLQFREYLHSDIRVKVQGSWGVRTGTIGVTTGWKPAFILMTRTSAYGSSEVLGPDDRVIAVQRNKRRYVPIEP